MNATQEAPELRLREERTDSWGDPFVQEWYCDVPPEGSGFVVVRAEWTDNFRVRKIFEVELAAH